MRNINNLKRSFIKLLPNSVLASAAFLLLSCDFSYELPEANSKEDTTAPTAFYGATVRGGNEWNIADFANGSISANTFVWDFGDGETSTDLEPSHSFPILLGINDYTVTLTATDANGLTDVYENTVSIENNGEPLADLELYYDLVNTEENNPVTIHSYSSFQVEKDRFPENTMDKDFSTYWTAQDGDLLEGDFKSDGEHIIYDLAATSELKVIRFSTDSKPDAYGYQILTSDSGTADADFTQLLPAEQGELMFTEPANADYQVHVVDVNARYVKLVAYGRFNADGNVRESAWSNFSEIEFFKTKE